MPSLIAPKEAQKIAQAVQQIVHSVALEAKAATGFSDRVADIKIKIVSPVPQAAKRRVARP